MKTCSTCQGTYPNNYAVCPQDGTLLQELGVWTEGSVIRGKYRLLNKVGQGGMGTVYKALHLAFDELRALKVIAPELLHDPLFVKRFKHEAVITRKLQHPNAVRVDDIDEAEDGRPFIVMEFIQGESLKKVIQEEGPLPISRVCSIIKQTASALDAAHRLGMVHRDIKPENIALIEGSEGEAVKVLDFGIAKLKEARLGEKPGLTLTGTGMVIGTPQYMSPEQAMGKRGDELDGRSDLYSLGVVMYEMLTADLPFKADTTMGMLLAHLQQPPRPIRTLRTELQLPEPIASLAMRLLEKDPAQRPANGKALIEEIAAAEMKITPLGATRVAQPGAVFALGGIRAQQEPARAVPPQDKVASVSSAIPAPPPPVKPWETVPPSMPPAAMPTPQPEKRPRWGIWIGIAILLVGVGGGGWYISYRHSSSVGTAPASQPPGQGGGTSQPTPNQPPASEQNPPASESPQRSPGTGEENQRTPAQTASEIPASTGNIAPTGPTTSVVKAVDPRKIKAAVTEGDLWFNKYQYNDAIKAYQKGLILDPSNAELRQKLDRARKAKATEERVLR
jgi:serine/threonine-protein kinase